MTKVALVNPGHGKRWTVSEPLHLGYLASYLEKYGIDVRIIDQLAGQNFIAELAAYQPDIVGITAVTPLAPAAYKLADTCRKKGIRTVLGGVHPSVLPDEAISHADVVIVGEGEKALLEVVKDTNLSGIIRTEYSRDIDEFPPPARHLMQQDFYLHRLEELKDVMAFLHSFPSSTRVATILTSRGCPFRCIFCHNSWRHSPVCFHSAERVLSEIRQLRRDYGVQALFFMDDNFLANKTRLQQICRGIQDEKMDIAWACNTSAHYITPDVVQIIREAGCREVVFGWESGSQKILDVLEKKTTVSGNSEAIRIAKSAGLSVTGTFMIGNPTETIEDIRLTQQFIRENDIDMHAVCITTPYPGTKLWDWCQERKLIPESFSWAHFNQNDLQVTASDTLSEKDIRKFYLETFGVKKVSLSRVIKRGLWHPLESISWVLQHPSVAARILLGRGKSN